MPLTTSVVPVCNPPRSEATRARSSESVSDERGVSDGRAHESSIPFEKRLSRSNELSAGLSFLKHKQLFKLQNASKVAATGMPRLHAKAAKSRGPPKP